MGLVCLGKTHMTEIAFSGLGLNPITATPPCVNDPDVVPGGSSSGAAASVAFGLAAAAVGSDTGGSVRVPSVWNDLVGLKTTHGHLSLKGVVPLCKTFDTVGPLCRSVEDAALMLGALGGCAADIKGSDLSGVRLAILDTIAMENVREDPKAAFMAAVVRLEEAGAEVEHVRFEPLRRAFELAGILYTVDAYAYWRDIIEADPSKMYHQILARIRAGAEFDAVDFVAGWAELNEIRAEYHAAMAGFDAVIMPTSPILPPNAKRLEEDGEFFVQENLMTLRNTRVGNLMGECSLTLPTGVPSCGIMLNAAPMSEARLLRIGAAAERALA
jgi:aspartyl-tRNA(Asn)/glutamyl-tRNA(Gln) amidotransferase subunit A